MPALTMRRLIPHLQLLSHLSRMIGGFLLVIVSVCMPVLVLLPAWGFFVLVLVVLLCCIIVVCVLHMFCAVWFACLLACNVCADRVPCRGRAASAAPTPGTAAPSPWSSPWPGWRLCGRCQRQRRREQLHGRAEAEEERAKALVAYADCPWLQEEWLNALVVWVVAGVWHYYTGCI